MKVLCIHNYYQATGGEDVTFANTCQLLRDRGHDVITYERRNEEITAYNVLQKLDLVRKTVWADDSYRDVSQLIEIEQPDIAHIVNSFPLISPSIYYACQLGDVSVVQDLPNYRLLCPAATLQRNGRICTDCLGKIPWRGVIHGCYRGSVAQTAVVSAMLISHRARRTWSTQVDMFIARTTFGKELFVAGGLPKEKITVVPNFLYTDPGQRTGHQGFACFVGRLSPEKGIATLLHAWEGMAIPLYVVGDGEVRPSLQAFCAEHNLPQVQFLGWQPRPELFSILKRAQFLVIPSEWYEPFGNILIEAFACGVPVIASDVGGPAEMVTDGEMGLHFQAGNAADLQKKVRWAVAHPEEMERFGRNGRKQYEAYYTAEANYEQLIQIYSSFRPDC